MKYSFSEQIRIKIKSSKMLKKFWQILPLPPTSIVLSNRRCKDNSTCNVGLFETWSDSVKHVEILIFLLGKIDFLDEGRQKSRKKDRIWLCEICWKSWPWPPPLWQNWFVKWPPIAGRPWHCFSTSLNGFQKLDKDWKKNWIHHFILNQGCL